MKKKIILTLTSIVSTLPLISVISCSQQDNSLEAKLRRLINDPSAFNKKLNSQVTSFNDLFSNQFVGLENAPIIIEPTQKIANWNNSLSEFDKGFYELKDYFLRSIEIPILKNIKDSKVLEIDFNVWFDVIIGEIANYKITTELPIKSNQLFIDNESNQNILVKNFSKEIKDTIENYIKNNKIDQAKLNATDGEKHINIKLPLSKINSLKNENLYLFWDKVNNPINNNQILSLYVYANNESLNDLNKIRNECLYFQISNINLS